MASHDLRLVRLLPRVAVVAISIGVLGASTRSLAADPPKPAKEAQARADATLPKWALARLDGNEPGQPPRGILRIVFSPDGTHLATRGVDQMVRLWDLASGKQIFAIDAHQHRVTGLAYSPDGRLLATSSVGEHEHVRLWDTATGKLVRELGGEGSFVEFTRDGAEVVVAGPKELGRYRVASGQPIEKRPIRHNPLAMSGDAQWVAYDIGMPPGLEWRIGVVSVFSKIIELIYQAEADRRCTEFSADGTWMAAGGGQDYRASVWDLRPTTGLVDGFPQEARPATSQMSLSGHAGPVQALAFSPDKRHLATASWDTTIRLWEIATGRTIVTLRGHREHVCAVAFSPDGRRLASGASGDTDMSIIVWDAAGAMFSPAVPASRIDRAALDRAWEQLAAEDPAVAYPAIGEILAAPNLALPYVERRMHGSVTAASDDAIRKLILQLDDNDFSVREGAQSRLAELRAIAEPLLKREAGTTNSAEVRHRILKIILEAPVENSALSAADRRRLHRIVLALETLATPAALQQLKNLASTETDDDVRRDATDAIQRIGSARNSPKK